MINVALLDERIERCLAILADNPHSQVFAALAEAYRRRGEFGRAFAVCKTGLKHHPDYAPAHVVMVKLFLHQKMFGEALASLKRAVELDGATRATDTLDAELHIAMGDRAAAKAAIDRLRLADPHNPALSDLVRDWKRMENAVQTTLPHRATREHEPSAPVPVTVQTAATAAKESVNWDEWVSTISRVPETNCVFAFDATGQIVAAETKPAAGLSPADVLSMYRRVDGLVRDAGWGGLSEIRVEASDGEVWSGCAGSFILGMTGSARMAFGAARRKALELAERIDLQKTDEDPNAAAGADGPPFVASGIVAQTEQLSERPKDERGGNDAV